MNVAKDSTATATTATVEPLRRIGRFAPSPTGPLHLGSLLAATGSYLDARHRGGRWHIRLEDLDTTRHVAGADVAILQTLEHFGFRADAAVVRQSERHELYEAALGRLGEQGMLFRCRCSRKEIAAAGVTDEPRCVSGCRSERLPDVGMALRISLSGLKERRLLDRSSREIHFDPRTHTDLVLRRRDGVIAYALAVVVDDAEQGITDVVRGGDLLAVTAWQLGLQQALGLPTPNYLHLPVVIEPDGAKLSKSRQALSVCTAAAPQQLRRVLGMLGQDCASLAPEARIEEIWSAAIAAWNPAAASHQTEVRA